MDKMIENISTNDKNVQKVRLNNVSFIRFISFTCIFFFHIILFWTPFGRQYFPLWFAVQVFLFISGFLYSKKEITNIKSFYIKNALKILIPAGIFIVFYFAIYLLAYLCGYQVFLFEEIAFGIYASGLGHYWFIYAICICYLITPILYKLSEAFQQRNISKSQILLLFILILIVIDAMLSQAGCSNLITSYCLGYMFRYIYDGKFFKNHKEIIAFCAFLVFAGATLLYYTLVNSGGGGGHPILHFNIL